MMQLPHGSFPTGARRVVEYGVACVPSRAERTAARKRQTRVRLFSLWVPLCVVILGGLISLYFLGICSYVITGGSMTGAVSKGSLAVERRVPVAALKVGDIITFHPPGEDTNVTHRIIAIDRGADGQLVFRTKGDANQDADPWHMTLNGSTQARYVFAVPWLGYVLAFFTLRWVRTALLALAALALIVGIIFHLRQEDHGHAVMVSRNPRSYGAGED